MRRPDSLVDEPVSESSAFNLRAGVIEHVLTAWIDTAAIALLEAVAIHRVVILA